MKLADILTALWPLITKIFGYVGVTLPELPEFPLFDLGGIIGGDDSEPSAPEA